MSQIIYGVDVSKPYGPKDVTKAMINCFTEAHSEDTGLEDNEDMSKTYCEEIIQKAFAETGGDFDNPTKDSLISVVSYLGEFSQNFRDPKIIEKHAKQIMTLVEGL